MMPLVACLVLFALSNRVLAQPQETQLVVIAAPQAVIPQSLGDNPFDEKIKELKESLPGKLETLIINISNRKIHFLERELLMELKEAINYEKPGGFIDLFSDSLKEKINAVLLTKIEKIGASQVTIKAKIVHINRRILSVREIITYLEPQPTFDSNLKLLATEIVNDVIHKPCGLISFKEYVKKHDHHTIGLGFGYQKGNQVTLGNMPREIRTTLPHSDDQRDRPGQFLDPTIPDNYLIRENTVKIDLGYRKSIEAYFSFWGIINIAIRTSAIRESEEVEHRNLFRKNYIKPEFTGEALIYYSVKSRSRQFFDGSSFSLPIFVTYPVFYCGKNRGFIFRIMGGTNILLPEKIELEAEQGWDRFGTQEVKQITDLGKLKEIEWYGGIDIEWSPAESYRFGIQPAFVYTDYNRNLNFPLFLQLENNVRLSIRANFSRSF